MTMPTYTIKFKKALTEKEANDFKSTLAPLVFVYYLEREIDQSSLKFGKRRKYATVVCTQKVAEAIAVLSKVASVELQSA